MAEREYKRLTRARPRARVAVISSANTSLWLGKDHLLCLDSNGYTENYKRFYFRDIQAIILRKTERQKYSSLFLGFVSGLCGLFAFINSELGWKVFLGILAGIFGLLFLIDVIAGPTSSCSLRTAVQTEDLPSMNRLRRARRVLNRVRPFIIEAQGQLTPEELARSWNQPSPGQQPATTPAPTAEPAPAPEAQPRYIVDDPNAPPRIIS
jgi:hypothetical protein